MIRSKKNVCGEMEQKGCLNLDFVREMQIWIKANLANTSMTKSTQTWSKVQLIIFKSKFTSFSLMHYFLTVFKTHLWF